MIINSLKMAAFGPFSNEIFIDFNKLNDKGIFLLTGPTGVGKTSIFDAISYCLYDSVSGANGIKGKIRSNYADNKTKTYVEMDFSINGKDYFIRRSPDQKLIGRGGKEVFYSSNVELKYGKEVYTKIREVNEKIVEIVGLTIDQFRQIVMIPQGEFVKLLTSSSSEKVEIFRKIFNTENLDNFQEKLKKEADICTKELESVKNDIKSKIEAIKTEDLNFINLRNQEELNMPLIIEGIDNLLKDMKKKYDEDIKVLENRSYVIELIERAYRNGVTLNKNLDELAKAKSEFDELIKDEKLILEIKEKLNKFMKAFHLDLLEKEITVTKKNKESDLKKISNNNDHINELKKGLNQLLLNKSELLKNEKTIENIKLEINELTKKININDEMISNKNKLNYHINEQDKITKELELLEIDNQKSKNEINNIKEEINQYSKKANLYLKFKEQYINCLNKLKDVTEDKTLFSDLASINKSIFSQNKKIKMLELEYKNSENHYLKIENQYLENQAYYLSLRLENNTPCPVCGSIHHPNIAKSSNDITKDMVDEAKKNNDLKYMLYSKELGILKGYKNQLDEQNLKIIKKYKTEDDYNKLLSDLTIECEQLKIEDEKYNVNNKLLDEKKSYLDELEGIWKDIQKEIENKKEEKNKLEVMITQINEKLNGYILINTRDLKDEKKIKEDKINKYLEELNSIEKEYNDKYSDYSKLDGINKTLKENISSYDNLLKIKEAEFNKEKETFNNDFHKYLLTSEEKTQLENKVSVYNKNYSILENKISSLTKETKGMEYCDLLDYYIEEMNKMKNEVVARQKSSSVLASDYKHNNKLFEEINDLYKKCNKSLNKTEMILKLSNIANGKNQQKLSFEKYILAVYFEEVLKASNIILSRLTNNRYRLTRKKEVTGGGQQGLDINVFDAYTGYERDCKTLSGGESFKAALSLALGLAEIIGRRAGGIEIKTMFIDEGFGSLDSQSLDVALNVLCDIKNNGRAIGIISHVEDLKDRIDTKIVLEGSSNGSKIKEIIF